MVFFFTFQTACDLCDLKSLDCVFNFLLTYHTVPVNLTMVLVVFKGCIFYIYIWLHTSVWLF